ncbi:MAG: hypothetical protein [Olavius algarvensis Delta 4 endosymbiont]|nr:MAG: hypothetical protein [Olavius algarvensis Delta 4 endosymbiont]
MLIWFFLFILPLRRAGKSGVRIPEENRARPWSVDSMIRI